MDRSLIFWIFGVVLMISFCGKCDGLRFVKQFLPGMVNADLPRWNSNRQGTLDNFGNGVNAFRTTREDNYEPLVSAAEYSPSPEAKPAPFGKCDTHQECKRRLLAYFNRISKLANVHTWKLHRYVEVQCSSHVEGPIYVHRIRSRVRERSLRHPRCVPVSIKFAKRTNFLRGNIAGGVLRQVGLDRFDIALKSKRSFPHRRRAGTLDGRSTHQSRAAQEPLQVLTSCGDEEDKRTHTFESGYFGFNRNNGSCAACSVHVCAKFSLTFWLTPANLIFTRPCPRHFTAVSCMPPKVPQCGRLRSITVTTRKLQHISKKVHNGQKCIIHESVQNVQVISAVRLSWFLGLTLLSVACAGPLGLLAEDEAAVSTTQNSPAQPVIVPDTTVATGSPSENASFSTGGAVAVSTTGTLSENESASTGASEVASSTGAAVEVSTSSASEQGSSTSGAVEASSFSATEQASTTSVNSEVSTTGAPEQVSTTIAGSESASTGNSEQVSTSGSSTEVSTTGQPQLPSTNDSSTGKPGVRKVSGQEHENRAAAKGTGDGLQICTWNVFRFGPTKFKQPDEFGERYGKEKLKMMVEQISNADILALQEYFDKSLVVINKLKDALTEASGVAWNFTVSESVGRTSKEQYVFLYRTDVAKAGGNDIFPQKNDVFSRTPFFTNFKVSKPGVSLKDITLGTIHTEPKSAVAEMNGLVETFDWAKTKFGTEDVMVLGDYNADCQYVRKSDWPTVKLFTDTNFQWFIPTGTDTAAMNSECTFDRAVVKSAKLKKAFVPGSLRVLDFVTQYGIKVAEARQLSDHFPVCMTFK